MYGMEQWLEQMQRKEDEEREMMIRIHGIEQMYPPQYRKVRLVGTSLVIGIPKNWINYLKWQPGYEAKLKLREDRHIEIDFTAPPPPPKPSLEEIREKVKAYRAMTNLLIKAMGRRK